MHPLILGAARWAAVLTMALTALLTPQAVIAASPAPASASATAAPSAAGAAKALARASAKPASRSQCPAAQAAVREFFIAADCSPCWAASPAEPTPPVGWRFDWIVPAGADAAMAVAALPEAAERAARADAAQRAPTGAGLLAPGRSSNGPPGRLAAGLAPRLTVVSGPAWQGYIGVELSLYATTGRRWPEGSSAWIALVERVEAGSEGTPVARDLVRSMAGPLPFPPAGGQTLKHLQALRWPTTAQPERLQARAWVEGPHGAVLAVTADQCP